MKKRVVMLVLMVLIMLFAMSGCDWKFPALDTKPKTKKELVAELFEKSTPVPTEAPTPEPLPTPSPTPIPTPTPTPIDWSKEYDDYFQKEQLLPENYRIDTSVPIEGVEVKVSLAQTETFCQLSLSLGNADIHVLANGNIAFLGKQDKNGQEWYFTRLDEENGLEEVLGFDISMNFNGGGEIVIGQIYQGKVVEGEKIYDIIDIVTSQYYGKMKIGLYINRDTQKIERLQTQYNEQEILGYIYEVTPIELPDGSVHAKSLTMEDFSAKYKKMILQGVASAFGDKLWD